MYLVIMRCHRTAAQTDFNIASSLRKITRKNINTQTTDINFIRRKILFAILLHA